NARLPVHIWLPVQSKVQTSSSDCRGVLAAVAPPSRQRKAPIILYAPPVGGDRFTNAHLAALLASHGYVVVAIDDFSHDQIPLASSDARMARDLFNVRSEAEFRELWRLGERRAEIEARIALGALDAFAGCATNDARWASHLELTRIGFVGYS